MSSEPHSIEKFKLDLKAELPQARSLGLKSYRPQGREKFLAGPISLHWLALASRCPGRAIVVALVLWYRHGLEKSISIQFNQSRWANFGLSRDAARRGVAALERAGLISVERLPGRKPTITLIINGETLGRVSQPEPAGAQEQKAPCLSGVP